MNKLAGRTREFFFLSGNLASWEAGFEGEDIPDEPGYKGMEFPHGDFLYKQKYSVFGVVTQQFISIRTILYRGKPVWGMKCCGLYNKIAAPFLERALVENYLNGRFIGGRGLQHFVHSDYSDYAYENNIVRNEFWKGFHGHDQVHFNIGGPNGGGNGSGKVISEIFIFGHYHGGFIHGSL